MLIYKEKQNCSCSINGQLNGVITNLNEKGDVKLYW
jgi:hypothetical protein